MTYVAELCACWCEQVSTRHGVASRRADSPGWMSLMGQKAENVTPSLGSLSATVASVGSEL